MLKGILPIFTNQSTLFSSLLNLKFAHDISFSCGNGQKTFYLITFLNELSPDGRRVVAAPFSSLKLLLVLTFLFKKMKSIRLESLLTDTYGSCNMGPILSDLDWQPLPSRKQNISMFASFKQWMFNMLLTIKCGLLKLCQKRVATIAEWIRLCLTSCIPGFKSQAHHLCFYQL